MCGHIKSAHGRVRSKGKDWQYCDDSQCMRDGQPQIREIIARADTYERWSVSRGTKKDQEKKGWEVPDEPLF